MKSRPHWKNNVAKPFIIPTGKGAVRSLKQINIIERPPVPYTGLIKKNINQCSAFATGVCIVPFSSTVSMARI